MDRLDDIKETIAIIREDVKHKKQKVKELKAGRDLKDLDTITLTNVLTLESEIKGILRVLTDLELVIYY